jgi:geranylgeranyl diphosphate synthase type I
MEIYTKLINQFSNLPHLKEWNEVQSLFQRVASSKPAHWLLPVRVCESVGGTQAQALSAMLAVALGHISIVLVDDMLDADERGEYRKLGEPAVANMAVALQSAALHVVMNRPAGFLEKSDSVSQACGTLAVEAVNEMFFATTIGQYWDVNSMVKDEDDYWKIAKAKSSPFFSTSLQLGALFGGADNKLSLQIKELGNIYGEMVQIHDDVHDTLENSATPDWDANRAPLPILFASTVDHPKRNRFNELHPLVKTNSQALEEAQEILIQCGGISFCIYQLLGRYEIVKEKISEIKIERRDVLEKIFDDIVSPVHQLFNEIDSTSAVQADTV